MHDSVLRNACKSIVNACVPLLPRRLSTFAKHSAEMAFWRRRLSKSGGVLQNTHYEYFYTSYFNIPREDYRDVCILDIGCGPRGSLEWAGIARERVGLDPLVKDYRKLGIGRHRMSYVCAPSERIPFQDEYFDFVTCFNALDHVDNIDETLSEIVRVLREGGSFLLITEINHPPTVTEPQTISEELLDRLARSFVPAQTRLSEIRSDHDVYGSLRENLPYNRESSRHPALLSARMIKRPAAA